MQIKLKNEKEIETTISKIMGKWLMTFLNILHYETLLTIILYTVTSALAFK